LEPVHCDAEPAPPPSAGWVSCVQVTDFNYLNRMRPYPRPAARRPERRQGRGGVAFLAAHPAPSRAGSPPRATIPACPPMTTTTSCGRTWSASAPSPCAARSSGSCTIRSWPRR